MATPTTGSGNLVDEFEEAFQSCLNVLTKDDPSPNSGDKDETKVEVEQTTSRFIDLARQMEAFFLQKRFLLSALKPELVTKEDISDLRLELIRKDELLKRHYEKIAHWQNMLADVQGWAKSPAQGGPNQQGSGVVGQNTGGVPNTAGGGLPTQQTPTGPQTPNQMGVSTMSSTLQQVQHMQQAQQQQQMQQQAQLQQQMQAQLQQQQQQMHAAQLHQQMQVSSQQAMFMQQQAAAAAAGAAGRGGFTPQGPPGAAAAVLQGPLAYLEKTTSNIGMTDGRR